jgi:hypothetical protein
MYPEAILVGDPLATMHESSGDGVAPPGWRIAACVALGPPITCLIAVELSTVQRQPEFCMPSQWDFPRSLIRLLCAGHIPPVQHACDELRAACATAAPVPPRRANSRIIARTRFMAFSYHRRTF